VADIVSLTGENRFITAYGLNLINNTDRPALMALKKISGLDDKKVDSKSIGFGLAPRINASGRFGSPKTAMELFLCEDYEKSLTIAQKLDFLNSERKNTENDIISEIYKMIDKNPSLINERVIFICGKNWHHGVIGIVASRIMERFGKPVFIASEENGEIRGSARSFGKFSIFEALTYTSEKLVKFGGHPAAGGFTIKEGMAEDFRNLLNEYALKNHRIMPFAEIKADVPVYASDLTVENIQGLDLLEPFGTENSKPLFLLENVNIINIIPISGGVHSKLRIKINYLRTEAIMFRKSPNELNVKAGDVCDMIVSLAVNHYMDTVSVGIYIDDIRPHGFIQTKYFAALNVFETFMRNEELPDNYYASMLPSRDSAVKIYKNIPESGINFDTLYLRLKDTEINYCHFCFAIEAMKQLGLIEISSENSEIRRIKDAPKTDLNSAPILAELREKIAGINK
nr:DHH family phosphoesterase [Ruminococcus sp.]